MSYYCDYVIVCTLPNLVSLYYYYVDVDDVCIVTEQYHCCDTFTLSM